MKFSYPAVVAVAATTFFDVGAQVVTTQPSVVQTDSRDIVVTFHADQGNKGLEGLGQNSKVYAHTGVITSLSTGPSDWKYAPKWLDNSPKYEMKWVATNTWTLTIPSINEYYGITDPDEIVKQLAFVFRNSDGSREGKTASGGDIFVNVEQPGYTMTLTSDMKGSSLRTGEGATFTVSTSQVSSIALYQDNSSASFAQRDNTTTLSAYRRFNRAGNFTIRAVATNSEGETLEKTIEVNVIADSEEKAYPGEEVRMGAVDNGDGSVTFCLAAPDKHSVQIVGSWNGYEAGASSLMYRHTVDGIPYFWQTVTGLEAGHDYFYYYIVDGSYNVGDPYANLVLDPWNDQWIPENVFPGLPSYPSDKVTDVPLAWYNSAMNDYDWKTDNFKGVDQSDLIIYELLIRDFTGTEGEANANGTIEGVIEHLDYIKNLGVNAVEFMPVMEFNGNNSWGYNPNFYFAPDKAYGTPADYRRLFDECHRRNLAVILDIVFNQSDGLHPWYQMYPIASNPFYNGSAPHSYSVLNDWKQEYPLVGRQWEDVLAYWLTEYRVDGFRFDLVKGLGDDDSYGNTYDAATNTWGTPNESYTNRYNATRVARMKKLCDSMRRINPNAYCINENLATAEEENAMARDGEINWANINNASSQFAMGYESDASLNRFYAVSDGRDWGSTVSYAESHDEERMAYKQTQWGVDGVKGNLEASMRRLGSVGAQMLLTPGAHMIWQFQEFGADQTTKNNSGNDTSPKKVIWSYLDNPDRLGLMHNYQELCALRKDNPEMFKRETTTRIELSSWAGRTITLVNGQRQLYLLVNPSTEASASIAAPVDLSSDAYQLMSASYNTNPTANASGVVLEPGAYAVYGTRDLTDITLPGNDILKVYTEGRSIIIEGDGSEKAQVYRTDGTAIGRDNLQAGLYIVALPGQNAVKVAIR